MEKEKNIKALLNNIESVNIKKSYLVKDYKNALEELNNKVNKRNTVMLLYGIALSIVAVRISFIDVVYCLSTFVGGGIVGLGIKELIKLKEKPIKEKIKNIKSNLDLVNEKKENLNNEISKYLEKNNSEDIINIIDKRLDEIKKEKEDLNNLRSFMDQDATYYDIKDVYVVKINNLKYFARLENPAKMLFRFVDIFNYVDIWSGVGPTFDETIDKYKRLYGKNIEFQSIKECEPVLLAYPDNLVPDYVLRQCFYKVNNVDLNNPILKKTMN